MAGMQAALKEWTIAIDALLQGQQILLVRKGGIQERGGQFRLAHNPVLLFPTRIHQRPYGLQRPWRDRAAAGAPHPSVPAGSPLQVKGWAEITHILPVQSPEQVEQLQAHHIWTRAWAVERLAWQPQRPAFGLLLRVYRLTQPQTIPTDPSYGGCRSWITLKQPIDVANSQPVLSAWAYQQRVEAVQAVLQPASEGRAE
jgi:hypothetical protein